VLCGCQAPTLPSGCHLYNYQATAIARRVAAKHHIDFRKYQQPQTDFDSRFGRWLVLWPNMDSTNGFQVIIDDKTQKTVSAGDVFIFQVSPDAGPEPKS
jgi:hypothetical protein